MGLNYTNLQEKSCFRCHCSPAVPASSQWLTGKGALTCAMEPVGWRPKNEVLTGGKPVALPDLTSPFRLFMNNHEGP